MFFQREYQLLGVLGTLLSSGHTVKAINLDINDDGMRRVPLGGERQRSIMTRPANQSSLQHPSKLPLAQLPMV